jgi:hypothetical protein
MSSLHEATFSIGDVAPKMSDLKAPTYEDRQPHRSTALASTCGCAKALNASHQGADLQNRWLFHGCAAKRLSA